MIINIDKNERLSSLAIGLTMAFFGLLRLPISALVFVGAGIYLIYRSITGHCFIYRWLNINRALMEPRYSQGLEMEVNNRPPLSVEQSDEVTEASWQSFPTSDAPAWTMGRREEN
jgi:uncharacterized membrane protein